MKSILPFSLSFFLSFFLGCVAEILSCDLGKHAEATLNGKPLPLVTKWVFDSLGQWDNGGILCIFLVPWTLLLLYSLMARREISSADRFIRQLYGFLCFGLTEACLFVFLVFHSCWPFIPHYITGLGRKVPMSAYIPNIVLSIVSLLIIIAGAKHVLCRRGKAVSA
jgi:hypothetical protein